MEIPFSTPQTISMFVCSCHAITKEDIIETLEVLGSNVNQEELQKHCKAGTECGGCCHQLEKIIHEASGMGQVNAAHSDV